MLSDEVLPGDVGLVALLSVKEAVSKATTSVTGSIIDFRHVVVTAWGDGHCRAIVPGGMRLTCRWAVGEGLMLSIVSVPHHAAVSRSTVTGALT
ncbi:hypothetical protein ABXS69_01325 [Actinomyces timonensis]|uniref:Uncharacterized protein n=1 Tax=Actinomyces timonensis TaxID=1288391 RepID=A0AAU8N070_9ACTO